MFLKMNVPSVPDVVVSTSGGFAKLLQSSRRSSTDAFGTGSFVPIATTMPATEAVPVCGSRGVCASNTIAATKNCFAPKVRRPKRNLLETDGWSLANFADVIQNDWSLGLCLKTQGSAAERRKNIATAEGRGYSSLDILRMLCSSG